MSATPQWTGSGRNRSLLSITEIEERICYLERQLATVRSSAHPSAAVLRKKIAEYMQSRQRLLRDTRQ